MINNNNTDRFKHWLLALLAISACTIAGCARFNDTPAPSSDYLFTPTLTAAHTATPAERALARFAPAVRVKDDWAGWNRPGTVMIERDHQGRDRVRIDPTRASVYTQIRTFSSAGGRDLTNYIYRMHFSRVPVRYKPFHITAGPNGGIMVVVTVDADQTPLLYTLVHTCGCYIAFIPTRALPPSLRPVDWPEPTQTVFGVTLPSEVDASGARLVLDVAGGEHRMIDLSPVDDVTEWQRQTLLLRPASGLNALPDADGGAQSIYIKEGRGQGWVRDTRKPFEKLLISWWSLDPRVGVDKRYGQPGDSAPSFYTSLKPWNRDVSDMRDFQRFLTFWGWRL